MVMRHAFSPGVYEIAPPNIRGKWIGERDFSLLEKVAAGLSASVPADALEAYLSIPDVWAHAVVFEQALLAPASGPPGTLHPLRNRAIAVWRGLIALLALKSPRGLPVEVRPLLWTSGDEFAQVATDLRPLSTIDRQYNWREHLGIVTYLSKPVALMVPSTIVCPARGGEAMLDDDVPWLQDGQLCDPLDESVSIDPSERIRLREVVQRLAARLRPLAPAGGAASLDPAEETRRQRIATILGLLNDFAEDLTRRIGKADVPMMRDIESGYSIPGWGGMHDNSVFAAFARLPVLTDDPRAVSSPLMLQVRSEFKATLNGGLMLDTNAAASLPDRAVNTRVWSVYNMASLAANPKFIDLIKADAAEKGVLAITPDELFTPTLCRLKGCTISGHRPFSSQASYILPFTPQVLYFLSPAELRDAVMITENGGDVVVVELRVSLGEEKISHTIRRTYRGNQIETRQPPTTLAIWPNFKAPDWDRYYVFSSGQSPQAVRPMMSVSAATMAEGMQSGSLRTRIAEAQRFGQEMPASSERWVFDGERSIEKLCVAPEAMLCSILDESGETPVGLLLLPPYEEAPPTDAIWRFGIDLGSTNTSVFVSKAGRAPEAVVLHPNLMQPFADPSEIARAQLWHDFSSNDDQTMPFLTVLKKRDASVGQRQPLLTSHIVFTKRELAKSLHLFYEAEGGTSFNIKWSKSLDARQDVKDFLSQLMLQCLAEAAKAGVPPHNVRWAFAYPEAFHVEQLEHLRAAQGKALDFAAKGKGAIEEGLTESLATALYFHIARPAVFNETAITFDVGGQTTDVTIWQDKKLVWRSSLRIGGQQIITEYMVHHPIFLDQLAPHDKQLAEAVSIRGQSKKMSPEMHEVIINSDAYERAFDFHHWAIAEESYCRILRDELMFTLGGLLYYTGKTISLLEARNRFDAGRDTVTVCMGGRGSLAFKKFINASYNPLLLTMMDEGAGREFHHVGLVYSDQPKTEVAAGLLSDFGDLKGGKLSPPLIPLGEEVLFGTAQVLRDAQTDLSSLDPEAVWRVASLSQLRKYHLLYANRLPEPLPFTTEHEKMLLMQVNHALEEEKKGAKKAVRMGDLMVSQPPFIIALRERVKQIVTLPRET